ncbi:MAG: helix-turn-helix domain-containing protein [Sediminicola sp.]|tara:strand:+ start:6632 stop:7462 length:831 start_codon:yes stop_codon:yes gene_type:complete
MQGARFITPEIKLSVLEAKYFKTEITLDEHVLVWLIEGESKVIQADTELVFKGGDIFLVPRNRLTTICNFPIDGKPHKAVAIHLSTKRLKSFYSNSTSQGKNGVRHTIPIYRDHALLSSFLGSLLPYFDIPNKLPEQIADLKITEAIVILREIDKGIDAVLANFDEPGKVDLISFMEKNYMFNMPLEKLGYLTGRSLSTFKRDFVKHFRTTPQRWLTQKRLELAYYQLSEMKRRPVDIYFEVGFENLSHFSFAFKKHFGMSPTELIDHKRDTDQYY